MSDYSAFEFSTDYILKLSQQKKIVIANLNLYQEYSKYFLKPVITL